MLECCVKFVTYQLSPWLPRLQIKMTKEMRAQIQEKGTSYQITVKKHKTKSNGQKIQKVQGGKDLRQTGAYPAAFGRRVAALHCSWLDSRFEFSSCVF